MKERFRFSKEKLVSAEEGLKSTEPVTRGSICSCDRLIQCIKLVLYIELILFLGWSSYTLWQTYDQQAVISFFNVVHEDRAAVDNVKTKDDDFLEVNVNPTEITPTDDGLNAISKLIGESKENENSEDRSVLEWGFPFFSYIHRGSGLFTDDSSEEARKSELDEGLKHINEDAENEESNDISESRQTSSVKEDQKEESNFSAEDVPSSAEILNNLKKLYESIEAARRDLQLENIHDDAFLENTENSKKDETLYHWDSSYTPSYSLSFGKSDNIKEPSLSEEHTKSNVMLPDSSNTKKPCDPYFFYLNNCDDDITDSLTPSSEHVESDSSKVDETTSDVTSEFWNWQPSLQSTIGWREFSTNAKVNPMDESTGETSTVSANGEDNDSPVGRIWEPYMGTWESWTPIDENVDDSADVSATLPELEKIDWGKETIFFGPRSPMKDLYEPCTIKFFNGLKVVKCSSSLADGEHSSDSSDITDFKKDSSTEEHTEYPENNWWPFGNVTREENVTDDTELFNEKSNTYDSSAIDRIEKEVIETSTSSEDSSVTSENSEYMKRIPIHPWWT